MALEAGAGSRRIWGYLATGNYFDALGVKPALGRFFHAEDDRQVNASPFAVLSYSCWRNRFAGDPGIEGRRVRINSLPYTVLGVAPRGFHGTELFYWPEIWVPMSMQPQIEGQSWLNDRSTFDVWLMGRLKPGVTRQQAEANLSAIAATQVREYPAQNRGRQRIGLTRPGLVGNAGRAPVEGFMTGLMLLAGLVLLAACANLASLLAARTADRGREIAIRMSIGAGRSRILRQLLTESAVLAALGGAAGWGLAYLLTGLLSQWRAPLDFPVQFDFQADARVFLFSLAATILSAVLFGVAPARQAWKTDSNQVLKGGSPEMGRGRRWAFRDILLVVQVALCAMLVAASAVSFTGLAKSVETPLGFEPGGVSTISFDLGLAQYSTAEGRNLQRRALEAVRELPGVSAAAFSNSVPLSTDYSTTTVFPDEAPDVPGVTGASATFYMVSPGYFRTMGTRLLAGRDFTWHDDAKAPLVAIVNETFARSMLGTRDAVGRHFRQWRGGPRVEIVGVVEDGKYFSLTETPTAAVFWPSPQSYNGTTVLLARSSLPPETVAGEISLAVSDLDGRLPLYGVGSLTQMLGFAFFPARAATLALGAFGILAMMLAVTGIYGLAAYSVSRRVREIGIRVAVGARPWQVLRFVLGRTATLLAIGSSAGLLLSLAAGGVLAKIVYQASAGDPVVLSAVAGIMLAIGIAAACGPARRAVSIDPLRALRQD